MKKGENIRIRVTEEEKTLLENKARDFGFSGISEYLRFVGRNCKEIGPVVGKTVKDKEG